MLAIFLMNKIIQHHVLKLNELEPIAMKIKGYLRKDIGSFLRCTRKKIIILQSSWSSSPFKLAAGFSL